MKYTVAGYTVDLGGTSDEALMKIAARIDVALGPESPADPDALAQTPAIGLESLSTEELEHLARALAADAAPLPRRAAPVPVKGPALAPTLTLAAQIGQLITTQSATNAILMKVAERLGRPVRRSVLRSPDGLVSGVVDEPVS